jgi:ankyrin repeat protein
MLAVLHSSADIVHLLLDQAGANVRIYNQYHLTAFDFVKYNLPIMADLIRHGAMTFTINDKNLFHWLMVNKHMRLARLLIEAGYVPPITLFQQRIRSLKSLCRLKIRFQILGSHFRQRVQTLPVKNKQLMKYILLDDI